MDKLKIASGILLICTWVCLILMCSSIQKKYMYRKRIQKGEGSISKNNKKYYLAISVVIASFIMSIPSILLSNFI